MSDKGQEARGKLLPCPFCGGEAVLEHGTEYAPWFEVDCPNCDAEGPTRPTEAEAIEAWNRRSERTAKAIEHDASVTDTDGYKYHRSEYLCGACKKKVLGGDDYCSHCGAKLDWSEL